MARTGRLASASISILLAAMPLACSSPPAEPSSAPPEGYEASIEAWCQGREERLRSPDGWLTVVGLHWLEPGANRFGSEPSLPVVLDAPGIPAEAGVIVLEDGAVRIESPAGSGMTIDGAPAGSRPLRTDADGAPDVIEAGRLRFYVIRRGERFGVRVKDPEAPARTGFNGIERFRTDPAWRVEARWEPFDKPETIAVPTVLGTVEPSICPGIARFEVDGREYALRPTVGSEEDENLFFVFRDATADDATYPAGRFLSARRPDGGSVVLDFNKAYNPPCAFTPFATCPLPPPENVLDVRIEAGERRYGSH